jgi:hypothetical protein
MSEGRERDGGSTATNVWANGAAPSSAFGVFSQGEKGRRIAVFGRFFRGRKKGSERGFKRRAFLAGDFSNRSGGYDDTG